jgi:hypothetical protein
MMLTATIILTFIVHMTAIRLYTEEYFLKHMSNEGIPEIQRSNLVSCVIQVCNFCEIISKQLIFLRLAFSYGGINITGDLLFSSHIVLRLVFFWSMQMMTTDSLHQWYKIYHEFVQISKIVIKSVSTLLMVIF